MLGYEPHKNRRFNDILAIVGKSRMTALIVAVNVLVFVLLSLTGGAEDSVNLYRWGAKFGPAIQAGDWYRLISPVFLHAGLFHIAANTFALIIFGPRLEQEFGSLAFVATYIVAGVCGVAASYLVSPVLSVGASGAVFGMIGAYGVYLVRNRREFGGQVNSVILNLIFILAVNIVFGLLWPGIDQAAHMGGLIAGAAMAFVASPRKVIEIEDDFMLFGAPIVRTRFARATRSNILLAAAAGVLVAIVISWWVTNNVEYDARTMAQYRLFESLTG